MTTQRRDNHSTEFGLWLRRQKRLDSKIHKFATTNIDYMWCNYGTGKWMLIEEQRYRDSGSKVSYSQQALFNILDKACKSDPLYHGLHLLHFQSTSPDDGNIYLDNERITKEQLFKFLNFEDWHTK